MNAMTPQDRIKVAIAYPFQNAARTDLLSDEACRIMLQRMHDDARAARQRAKNRDGMIHGMSGQANRKCSENRRSPIGQRRYEAVKNMLIRRGKPMTVASIRSDLNKELRGCHDDVRGVLFRLVQDGYATMQPGPVTYYQAVPPEKSVTGDFPC